MSLSLGGAPSLGSPAFNSPSFDSSVSPTLDPNIQVDLITTPGRVAATETLVLRTPYGVGPPMRLHDYDQLYGVPGLYEHVVQGVLDCRSPVVLAETLDDAARNEFGIEMKDLRVFDAGAGNGVSGHELAKQGATVLVGADIHRGARMAAGRDRPNLYPTYLTTDLSDTKRLAGVVQSRGLNCLTSVGALGGGHIPRSSIEGLWKAFPKGSVLAFTTPVNIAELSPQFNGFLESLKADQNMRVLPEIEFVHRRTMSGDPIRFNAVVAQKK